MVKIEASTVAEDWEWEEGNQVPILADLDGAEIIAHVFETAAYEGYAFTLYRKDGKLFECNGAHCSCMGLEGQWSPEETTIEALRTRRWNGYPIGEHDAGKFMEHLK